MKYIFLNIKVDFIRLNMDSDVGQMTIFVWAEGYDSFGEILNAVIADL